MDTNKGPFKKIKFSKLFQTEETQFLIITALKFLGVAVMISCFVAFYIFRNVRFNYYFFVSQGFGNAVELKTAFYEYVLSSFFDLLPLMLGFYVALFFAGLYIGKMILRPFKNIGDYCEEVMENPDVDFRIDQFSDYRTLTSFSEFFLEHLRDARKKNVKLHKYDIPKRFMGIHSPTFEKQFIFNFSFIMIILSIISTMAIVDVAGDVYTNVVELAILTLKGKLDDGTRSFILSQKSFTEELYLYTGSQVFVFYTILAIHLYGKASGAAFGIFSTMRSFLKGNYFTRVHLVGYYHVRDYTRSLNKYLDYIQKNYCDRNNDND